MCHPPDRDRAPALGKLEQKRKAAFDLGLERAPVSLRGAGMSGHDVPEQDVVSDTELREHSVDDGGSRLSGTGAGQLALGCERDAGHTCASIPGRFADDQEGCIAA